MVQASLDAAVTQQLEQIEARLAAAWKERDCAAWGALLADDWSVTHIDAQVIDKAHALDLCRTGPALTSSVEELAVRSYGDAAIVTGRTTATTSGPDAVTVRLRFTDVFVRRDGRWFVVASHATRVPD